MIDPISLTVAIGSVILGFFSGIGFHRIFSSSCKWGSLSFNMNSDTQLDKTQTNNVANK